MATTTHIWQPPPIYGNHHPYMVRLDEAPAAGAPHAGKATGKATSAGAGAAKGKGKGKGKGGGGGGKGGGFGYHVGEWEYSAKWASYTRRSPAPAVTLPQAGAAPAVAVKCLMMQKVGRDRDRHSIAEYSHDAYLAHSADRTAYTVPDGH